MIGIINLSIINCLIGLMLFICSCTSKNLTKQTKRKCVLDSRGCWGEAHWCGTSDAGLIGGNGYYKCVGDTYTETTKDPAKQYYYGTCWTCSTNGLCSPDGSSHWEQLDPKKYPKNWRGCTTCCDDTKS
jgi:hypothetical protein